MMRVMLLPGQAGKRVVVINDDGEIIQELEVAGSAKETMPETESKTGLTLKLTGETGNVFFMIGKARRTLQKSGLPNWEAIFNEFHEKATSGDYDHAMATAMEYFEVE
jgi:DNA/RNA endonuclease YhcR with UshA esterase domain